MATESIYPKLNEEEEIIDKEELDKIITTEINGALSKERYKLMDFKKDTIDTTLQHHLKSKKRYNLLGSIAKIGGLIITTTLTVATIVTTSGIIIPFFVVPLCGGLTLLSVGLTESVQKILKSKKHHNAKKINILRDTLSKMEIYIEKARDDKTITLEEIESFHKILDANTSKMTKVSDKKSSKKNDKDLETLLLQLIRSNPQLHSYVNASHPLST